MTNKSSLSRQVVLITGASAGIGSALAETLATKFPGIRMVLTARSQEKLESLASKCRLAGAGVLVVPADLSDTEQVQSLAKKAIEEFGGVDALVNNAGYGQMGPIELIPPEAAKQQFDVNFFGPLFLTQALIPSMRARGGGRIVNISSFGGRMAFPAGGLYSSSKFALEALSDVLRMELGAFNIKVSVIEPGPVKTEFFQGISEQIRKTVGSPETTPYRAAFKKIENIDEQTSTLGWTSEQVAEVIVQALTDLEPHPRYVAATGGDIFLFLMTKVLPTWITDTFWKNFYGIDKVEEEWKNQRSEL